jgi:hypothetical protein
MTIVLESGATVSSAAFKTANIDEPPVPSVDQSEGQALNSGLQQFFAKHALLGSDGLAEIVSVPLTDDEMSALRTRVHDSISALMVARGIAAVPD